MLSRSNISLMRSTIYMFIMQIKFTPIIQNVLNKLISILIESIFPSFNWIYLVDFPLFN